MKQLKIKLIEKESPFKSDPRCANDLWGLIIITYKDIVIMECEWDLTSFIEWYLEKKNFLRNEKFPFDYNQSIAKSRELLFDKIEEFDDLNKEFEYEDYLIEYFRNHHFHLQGTDTQDFYIGLISNGNGQISWKSDQYYAKEFDMNNLLNETDVEIKKFLTKIQFNKVEKNYFKEK